MRTTLVIQLLVLGTARGSVLQERACNGNNCARAVTGTRTGKMPDEASRRADCSSFLLATVTPDTRYFRLKKRWLLLVSMLISPRTDSTSTITLTGFSTATAVVATTTVPLPPARRDGVPRAVTIIPTGIPAYASPCAGASAYSSACSCWGVTGRTTTAPSPTAFTTTTVVVPTTLSVTATERARCTKPGCVIPPRCPNTPAGTYCGCAPDVSGKSALYRAALAGFPLPDASGNNPQLGCTGLTTLR